jgi:hypothetical protein
MIVRRKQKEFALQQHISFPHRTGITELQSRKENILSQLFAKGATPEEMSKYRKLLGGVTSAEQLQNPKFVTKFSNWNSSAALKKAAQKTAVPGNFVKTVGKLVRKVR